MTTRNKIVSATSAVGWAAATLVVGSLLGAAIAASDWQPASPYEATSQGPGRGLSDTDSPPYWKKGVSTW